MSAVPTASSSEEFRDNLTYPEPRGEHLQTILSDDYKTFLNSISRKQLVSHKKFDNFESLHAEIDH